MSDAPLQPFAPPTALFTDLHFAGLSAGFALELVLFFAFSFWAVYTIVAIYHWFRFSHASLVTFPAVATHLIVSFALATYILTGNRVL
ncbi:MAG TPA: hypothetical protein VFP46_01000 [Candidatus Paceibacterota bacterium]|nr:hypothetical protein [Candidatus Paceibacterota bacterium]